MHATLDQAWLHQLNDIMVYGKEASPRGMLTKELPQKTLIFDMNWPVITIPEREMGYRFMAAEAWWILSGKNDVASIAPYSKEIAKFSDDGVLFFGSYGPPIVDQLNYVVQTLLRDPDTRQAVITTWRQNPPPTKDVPCTIAFSFMIRDGRLNCHVFMRSSDNWLGIPYDAFNFTMVTCEVLRQLNNCLREDGQPPIRLGTMFLTAASSHLYQRNFDMVDKVLHPARRDYASCAAVPEYLYGIYANEPISQYYTTSQFLGYLKDVIDPKNTEKVWRWWNRPLGESMVVPDMTDG